MPGELIPKILVNLDCLLGVENGSGVGTSSRVSMSEDVGKELDLGWNTGEDARTAMLRPRMDGVTRMGGK